MKKVLFLACTFVLFVSSSVSANEKMLKSPIPLGLETKTVNDSPKSIDNLVGHHKNEVKTFFSDIDGTLIPLDKSVPKGTIPQSVILAVKELQNANIPLYLITGRSSREARLIAQKIGINNQYVIGQQGAEILDPNGVLVYEDGISSSDVKKIIGYVESFNKQNNHSIIPFVYVKGTLYMFDKFDLPYVLDKPVVISSISEIGRDFTAIKVGLYSDDINKLKTLQHQLIKLRPNLNIVISADCYCDISSKTATKGHAIKILSEMLKIDLKNAVTVGDAENDISMLKLLRDNGGLAIAVGNADKQVKENANYVTTSAANNGFLNAVKNVLVNNKVLKQK